MDFRDYQYLIQSDLYRYTGNVSKKSFMSNLKSNPGYMYTFWMRTVAFCNQNKIIKITIGKIARFILNHYMYKFGISIPPETKIGSGLMIGHFSGIIVNEFAVIGKNAGISQGVTIGQTNRGKMKGVPTIGDNVYIGPGAKIIGNITIGNNVAIGANCVVTKDIPDNAVVVGVPGRIISYEGATGYVNRIDYDNYIRINQ